MKARERREKWEAEKEVKWILGGLDTVQWTGRRSKRRLRSRGQEAKRRVPAKSGGGKELNLEVAVPSFIQSVL